MGTEGPLIWIALFYLGIAVLILFGVPLYGAAMIIRDWLKK
tara:strand:- start:363 stop:485 length:123 start_codon:yes stop_codon:yes gene_type:complete